MPQKKNVTVFDHPLITHKITLLRDTGTNSKMFRELVEEIAMLMGYEALRDLPTVEVDVQTPICRTKCRTVKQDLVLVPILRAGLGMVGGMLALMPNARVGHLGAYRDHETLEPRTYYKNFPEGIEDSIVFILDPMLATGGSAIAGVDYVKETGAKNIKFLSILAAPEGIERLSEAHPDIQVYCACVDEKLNDIGYIVPGLGDAGDRIFGSKQKMQ